MEEGIDVTCVDVYLMRRSTDYGKHDEGAKGGVGRDLVTSKYVHQLGFR